MRNFQKFLGVLVVLSLTTGLMAQRTEIQYFRPYDKDGLNIFEPSKADIVQYNGFAIRIGGSFTQQYQALSHENDANPNLVPFRGGQVDANELYDLGNGFNLATANLNFDFQIEDGIRVSLENYMSSRHHPEFWVKGGYIQMDKLPMFGNPEWFTKHVRVKIGHFQPNYGDQQFRRTDNGNAIWNPFIGNYIMDAFTTEIGGEAYIFPNDDLMFMLGVNNGLIAGDVTTRERQPSVYLKAAYDKQINDDLRFRLSASYYGNNGSARNTLFAGDRTGSRFYLAMEPAYVLPRGASAYAPVSATGNFTSGRISPNFTQTVSTFQISPFVKFKGLEVFGTYEAATGKASFENSERDFGQYSIEGLYRFLPNEQAFVGARYNSASGDLGGGNSDVSINRTELSAGWFPSRNLLLKVGYINQDYLDFNADDFRHEGNFNGFMVEAVVGF